MMSIEDNLERLEILSQQACILGVDIDDLSEKLDEELLPIVHYGYIDNFKEELNGTDIELLNKNRLDFLNYLCTLEERVEAPEGMRKLVESAIWRYNGNAPLVKNKFIEHSDDYLTDNKKIYQLYWHVKYGMFNELPNKMETRMIAAGSSWQANIITSWNYDNKECKDLDGICLVRAKCFYTKESKIPEGKRVGDTCEFMNYVFTTRNIRCIGIIPELHYIRILGKYISHISGLSGRLAKTLFTPDNHFDISWYSIGKRLNAGTGNSVTVKITRNGRTYEISNNFHINPSNEFDTPISDFIYALAKAKEKKLIPCHVTNNYIKIAYIDDNGHIVVKNVFDMKFGESTR